MSSAYNVRLTQGAASDLADLIAWIEARDGPSRAKAVIAEFRDCFSSLTELPSRGTFPEELLALGIRDFRELYLGSWRIIYRVMGEDVFILLVIDGRRDLQTILERRILQSGGIPHT